MRKSFLNVINLLAIIVIVMAIFLLLPRRSNLLSPNTSGFTSFADTTLKVHEVFDLGIEFSNASQNQAIIMQSVTFSGNLPNHIQLLHEMILLPSDSPPNSAGSILGLRGWPPGSNDGPAYIVHPLDGYQLSPHSNATVVLAFAADIPGAYILGPFTVHAEAAGLFGSILGTSVSEETYTQYGVMCVQITQELCKSAQDSIKA